MCFWKKKKEEPVPPPPEPTESEYPTDFKRESITWFEIRDELEELGLECQLKPAYVPDLRLTTTDEEGWAKIVPFLTYSGEWYAVEDSDCDDYARYSSADASKYFRLGTCLQCNGDIDNDQAKGNHAFGLVRIGPKQWRLFDSNAGFVYAGVLFKFGENGYTPSSWKI